MNEDTREIEAIGNMVEEDVEGEDVVSDISEDKNIFLMDVAEVVGKTVAAFVKL